MLQSGTIVECSFIIRHLIAEGGMAEVYLAESQSNKQIFAIKRSPACLVEEAELINNFCHPNIVKGNKLLGGGADNFLVMEYIDGKEVDYFIDLAKMRPLHDRACLALAIGLQACEALNYVFSYRDKFGAELELVHKDISPQNLMVCFSGIVKLLDFGLAQTKNNLDCDNQEIVKGNLPYMSPEQISGQKLGQASDIYSLALVLSEIVRGEKWRPRTKKEDPFSELASLTSSGSIKALLEVLRKGLTGDPACRTASSEEFKHDLSSVQQKFGFFDSRKFLAQSFSWPRLVASGGGEETSAHLIVHLLGFLGLIITIIAIFIGLGNEIFVPDLKIGTDYIGELPYKIFAPLRFGR